MLCASLANFIIFGARILPRIWLRISPEVFEELSCFLSLGFRGPASGLIWALRAQSWKKSSRGLSAPGSRKSKRSRKRVKIVEKQSILTLFRLRFRLFWASRGREARELIFRLFFQLWARRAQMTPVAGQSFRNPFVANGDQKKFTKHPRHFQCKFSRQIREKKNLQKFSGERAK